MTPRVTCKQQSGYFRPLINARPTSTPRLLRLQRNLPATSEKRLRHHHRESLDQSLHPSPRLGAFEIAAVTARAE